MLRAAIAVTRALCPRFLAMAGHEGKPSGKRECLLLLARLLLYFFSGHLESSATIYSVLQVVLFLELLSHFHITYCKKILEESGIA